MVDINLIGEEEKQEPVTGPQPQTQEEPQPGIGLESSGFARAEEGPTFVTDYPELDEGSGGSVRKLIFLGTFVIIAGVVGYFLFLKKEPADEVLQTLNEPEATEMVTEKNAEPQPLAQEPQTEAEIPQPAETQTATPPTTQSPTQQRPETTTPVTSRPAPQRTAQALSPSEQEMVESVQASYLALDNLSTALSSGGTLSLARFSGESFLVELVTASDTELPGLLNRIRAALQAGDVRIVHQENYTLHGPSAVKATVAGSLDRAALAAGISGGVQYFELNEFLDWLRNSARQNGAGVRSVNRSGPSMEDGYSVTPVQIAVDGSLQSTLSLMQTLAQAGPNIHVEKVSLINKDPRVNTTDAMSLVLVLHHYAR